MFRTINTAQIRVSLKGIEPEIWRRLLVPSDFNLGQLHFIIQAAFNWWNSHLHEFRIGGLRYGNVEILTEDAYEGDPRVFDSSDVRLRDFEQGTNFGYFYDFGDNWHHTIEIEKFSSQDDAPQHATCTAGANAKPPEDVGGVPGYERFLEIMSDRANSEHAHIKKWCGGQFDPHWFDLEIVNNDVRNALRTNVKRRLHQPKLKR